MKRCIDCGRLPTEEHWSICHRVARACGDPEPWSKIARSLALIADAIGYPKTAREMKEMVEEFESPGGEVREVNSDGALG